MTEYKVVTLRTDLGENLGDRLTAIAADGWRVVGCAETTLYLTVIMSREPPVTYVPPRVSPRDRLGFRVP